MPADEPSTAPAPGGARQVATPHLRPRAHFTARSTWLNDPNGLVRHDGLYHLHFQTNPSDVVWGSMSWGHATSRDLVTWTERRVALPHTGDAAVFSGSVVLDHHDSSGLGGGRAPLVAFWTRHDETDGLQTQCVSWSTDGGETWTPYPGNPVLDRGSTDFRDPKVFWHEPERCWVMVSVEAQLRQVLLHRSEDLLTWTHASTFGPAGATDGVWECPDLVELPVAGTDRTAWALLVSVLDGGPVGGSGTQWFLGTLDGLTFVPAGPDHGAQVRWLDHGPDHYATVTFDNVPERRLAVGWASNWAYAAEVPTAPWRGCMTLVRDLDLVAAGDRLLLRQRPVLPEDAPVDRHARVVPAGGRGTLTLTTRSGTDPLTVTVDAGRGLLTLDRSRCGAQLGEVFSAVVEAALPVTGDVDVLVVVDGCVVEVFAAGGLLTLTVQVFPPAPLERAVWAPG